jgi:hypothetical protein
VNADAPFGASSDCIVLAVGASCSITLTFTAPAGGASAPSTTVYTGSVTVATDRAAPSVVASVHAVGEHSLVLHYYRSILRREPDAGGKSFWESEATRMVSLGANINETWFALASSFYGSGEYQAFHADDASYVTDLYRTFFNREPDAGGLAYWAGQVAGGMSREAVLNAFMFSPEFAVFTQAIFGNTAARAEINVVMDYYRGLLARLPDTTGFLYWRGQFRAAQCAPNAAASVRQQADTISKSFMSSPEYTARSRSNAQFVADMYNAFMRRGADQPGLLYWQAQLDAGKMTREQVRTNFLESPEFTQRVNAVIAQGC